MVFPLIPILLGAATVGSAALSSSAAKNAAKTTAAAAQQASDQGLAAAREVSQTLRDNANTNNELLAKIYGDNTKLLTPAVQSGDAARDAINALLGVPVYRQETSPDYEAYVNDNPDILANFEKYGDQFPDKASFGKWFKDSYGDMNPAELKTDTRQVLDEEAPQRQADAFQRFRDGTGYQFQMDEGVRALDQSAAARGLLNSGKAVKSVQKFGSDLAGQSAGQYINYLANQQSVGSNAANALAGVGNQYATNVAANNTGATTGAANALLGATSAAGRYGVGAADTTAQAGLAGASNISNLLGQAVSAYGAYSGGTSSYAQPSKTAQYGAPNPYSLTGYGLNTAYT